MNPVAIFKALGHEQRYALFLDLVNGSKPSSIDGITSEDTACCVLDLTEQHNLAQSTISHHLRVLVNSGLVRQERRGTYRIYRVDEKAWQTFREYVATLNVCCTSDHCPPMGWLPRE